MFLLHLRLLSWRNYIIRKRHWKLTIVEVLTPILLFTLSAYGYGAKSDNFKKINVTTPTYYPPYNEDLLHSHFKMGIWYAPYSEMNEMLMSSVLEELQVPSTEFKNFKSEKELLEYYDKAGGETKAAAIIFHSEDPHHFNYSLSLVDKDVKWETNKLFCKDIDCLGTSNYIDEGFIGLQMTLDLAFIKLVSGAESLNTTLSVQKFPYPPHVEDSSLRGFYFELLPLITILSFSFMYPTILYQIVEEKSSGAKEFMKISGFNTRTIWIGWILQALCTNIFSVAAMVFLLKIPLWGEAPIEHSDGILLFLFLFLYFLASLSFCLFISTFFNGQCVGMTVGIFLDILTYFIPKEILASCENITKIVRTLLGLFPNMSLQYGYTLISSAEDKGLGVQWDNWWGYHDRDVSMGEIFLTLLCSSTFLILATLYRDNINPGKYGIRKPFYFPIKLLIRSIQRCTGKHRTNGYNFFVNTEQSFFKIQMKIDGLTKQYKEKVVVSNLNLDLHSNGITVLLGQNGAGKSTVMSIITGLIKPTSGSITIYGEDVYENSHFRETMGLCTQHNLLFDELTVKEHLQFFAKVKGLGEAKVEIKNILKRMELTEKKNCLAQFLSGGMKRKLCLAIALIGKPKILILDEPTSGIDQESRRKIWDTLKKIGKKTTILLSTHYMDEADILADYVAIMDKGKLKCFGTPLELKRKYGGEYRLKSDSLSDKVCRLSIEDETRRREFLMKCQKLEDENVSVDLSVSTLKDVFLNIIKRIPKIMEQPSPIRDSVQPSPSLYRRTGALLLKRCFFTRRNLYWYLPRFVVALILFQVALYLKQGIDRLGNNHPGQAFHVTLQSYENAEVYFSSSGSQNLKEHYKRMIEQNAFEVTHEDEEIIRRGIQDPEFYKKQLIAGGEFRDQEVNVRYSIFALHSAPISLNLATNALAKTILGEKYSISCSNRPLGINQEFVPELSETIFVIQWLILVPTGMLFLISNFIIFPFTELSTNFLQIQLLSGVSPSLYWFLNLLFDLFVFTLKIVTFIAISIFIDYLVFSSAYYGLVEYEFISAIFMMYAFSSIPFAYLFAKGKSLAKSCARFAVLGLISGLVPTGILIVSDITKSGNAGKFLSPFFLLVSPQYGLSYWCYKFAKNYVKNFNWDHMEMNKKLHLCDVEPNPCCSDNESAECLNYKSYFYGEYVNISLTLISGLLYFTILIFSGKRLIARVKRSSKSDPLLAENDKNSRLLARELQKNFGKAQVVNNLNMNLKKNTCYGFLGVNGAGKTTTFRMLAKDLEFDGGNVNLKKNDWISIADKKYSETLTYCPQADGLNLQLTGEEILKTISLLRGYSLEESKEIATYLLNCFGLDKYRNMPCLHYSGGNKRKLCTCIVLIGDPTVILMDEPTSGVDPVSQQDFWEYISSIKKRTSILLCSHSMDEIEELCDEFLIMNAGSLQDKGSAIELKNKYAKGYRITIQLKSSYHNVGALKDELKNFAMIEKQYHERKICCRTTKALQVSQIFARLQEIMTRHNCIEDFLVSSRTLEDVFRSVGENSNG